MNSVIRYLNPAAVRSGEREVSTGWRLRGLQGEREGDRQGVSGEGSGAEGSGEGAFGVRGERDLIRRPGGGCIDRRVS